MFFDFLKDFFGFATPPQENEVQHFDFHDGFKLNGIYDFLK